MDNVLQWPLIQFIEGGVECIARPIRVMDDSGSIFTVQALYTKDTRLSDAFDALEDSGLAVVSRL